MQSLPQLTLWQVLICSPVYGPPIEMQQDKQGVAQGSIKEAVKGEVVKALEAQAGFGSALLEQMSHAHPQPGSANDGSVQRYSQLRQCLTLVTKAAYPGLSLSHPHISIGSEPITRVSLVRLGNCAAEMRKTDCSGKTRLVQHVPSSS